MQSLAATQSSTEAAAFDALAIWGPEALALALTMRNDGPRSVETKADAFDLTTPADGAIERLLRERISAAFPDHAVVGEEQGGSVGHAGWQWVLDPIDGTFNYFTGLPGSACSIALLRGDDIRVGAVVDYTSGHVFRARAGAGALTQDPLGALPRADYSAAGEARVFLEWGSERLGEFELEILASLSRVRPVVPRLVGGAAYALLAVALQGGCFVGIGLRLWDVAGGVLLAQEAGQKVRWWRGADPFVHLLVGNDADVNAFAPVVAKLAARAEEQRGVIAIRG
jgi:myo-inositol-1(or 4)-monophosphatase